MAQGRQAPRRERLEMGAEPGAAGGVVARVVAVLRLQLRQKVLKVGEPGRPPVGVPRVGRRGDGPGRHPDRVPLVRRVR